MTACEFITFLHNAGATREANARLHGMPLVFAKGGLDKWRMLRIGDGYANVNDLIRFVTINNLEDYEVRLSVVRKLYRSDVEIDYEADEDPIVNIIWER